MLKIIGGTARGRRLETLPNSPHVRPILARVKKSLFDILAPQMHGARFLDLYCGTGPVGLEALSRGAARAAFLDKDPRCVTLIHKNLALLRFADRADVLAGDVLRDVGILREAFDIVFMGPPYKDDMKKPLALVAPTLDKLERHNLTLAHSRVIAQHHKKEAIPSETDTFLLERQNRYGETLLSFYRRKDPS